MTREQIEARILEIKKLKLKIYKEQPYRFLSPIGKMEEFLDEALSGKYLTAFMSSANGTGKTTTIVGLIANLCFPNDNPFFQQPVIQDWKWLKRGRIVSDTTTIKETIIPMIEEMIPKKHYTRSKAGKEFWSKWKMRDDKGNVVFEWDLMTYEQDPKQFESANLGIVIFDEPPPFSIYTASIARLKQGGICLIFATPLGSNIGSAWLYQNIVSDPNRKDNDFFYMTASKEDACLEHGVRGFLPHEQIEREMKQYPEEEILPRIFGEFSQVKGRVIKEYDEKIHVLDQIFDVNKEDYAVVQLWDTHARVNEAIMWVAINRSGTAFIVDELWIDAGLDEIVAKIKEIDSRYRIVKRLIDPSAFNVDKRIELTGKYGDIKGVSFAQILHEKYGLKYEPASKRRADGITMIREALRYNFQAGSWVQYPTLFVFPHCTRTRWEFINWMWDDWRGVTAERKDPRDKPQDKNDHMMENLGRFFLEGTTFTEPVSEVMKVDRSAIVEERTYF
jgi:phage terminase large subunit-like protein